MKLRVHRELGQDCFPASCKLTQQETQVKPLKQQQQGAVETARRWEEAGGVGGRRSSSSMRQVNGGKWMGFADDAQTVRGWERAP